MRPFAATLCLGAALLAAAAGARAESIDQVRRGFAQMIYEDAGPDINREAPQPLLRAVVVLRVRLDDHDHWHADVMRENDVEPGLTRKAIASVEHLPHAMEMTKPTPAAAPLSAARKVVSECAIRRAMAPNSLRIQRHTSVVPLALVRLATASSIMRRSPPALNAGSAPVSTIVRTSASWVSSSSARRSWRTSGAVSTFKRSGSTSVTSARSPLRWS